MTLLTLEQPLNQWPNGRYRSRYSPVGDFSFSGPFVHGESITLTSGSLNFGTKTQQSPLIWDDFAGGTDGQLLTAYDATWQAYGGHSGALIGQGADARYTGGKFAYNTSARHEFDTNFKTLGASRTRYLSYMWRTKDLVINGADEGVLKMCRLTSSAAIGGGGVYNQKGAHYLSALIPQNDGDPFMGFYDSANVDTTNFGPGGGNAYISLPINQWCRIDMYVRMSNVNVANGIFSCGVLGGTTYSRTDLIQNVSGQPELLLDSMILGLMQANAEGDYSQMITDVYMDNTPSRFEVINNANYALATIRENQPYTAWANSEVTLTGNIEAIPGDKWLVFVNDSGVASTPFYLVGA